MKLFNFSTILKLNFWILILSGVVCLSGCRQDSSNSKIENLKIIRGAKQCALPGEAFQKKLIIEVQGAQQKVQ